MLTDVVIVDCDMRKWGDRPHWRFSTTLLGTDDHGTWIGAPRGTAYSGPRGEGHWPHAFATLIPTDGWWIASFNESTSDIAVYVDITTVARWPEPGHVTAIDLDLDVVRPQGGAVYIDDEDEFAEHRVKYEYPVHVVERALETCETIRLAVEQRREPFDKVGFEWLARVGELSGA